MPRLIRVPFICTILFLLTAELAGQEKLKETPYYPLQVGTTWHYRSGDSKFSVRVARHEKVGDTLCALLETRRDGKAVAAEHLAVAADGVYRHDLTAMLPKSVTQTLKPPMLVLSLPPKKDDAWKVDSKSGGKTFRGSFVVDEQEIKVLAGTYKTFRVRSRDLEINGLKAAITTHFAEGVGTVKQIIEVGDAKAEIELEKFETGGK